METENGWNSGEKIMNRRVIHQATGMSLSMAYTPRPDDEALIELIHCGERACAIVAGGVKEAALQAYKARDLETWLRIFRMAA